MEQPFGDDLHFGEICEVKYSSQKIPIAAIQVSRDDLASSSNMFFYGRSDSLRQEFADEFVRRIAGIDYVKMNIVNIYIDGICLNIRQCAYYFEIDFYTLSIASNSSLLFGAAFEFMKQVSNQRNLVQAKHIFLINNVDMGINCITRVGKKKDNISAFVEDALKNIIDKKSSTTLFVLVGTKLPCTITNRCLPIRCHVPDPDPVPVPNPDLKEGLELGFIENHWKDGLKKLQSLRSTQEILCFIKDLVQLMIVSCAIKSHQIRSLFYATNKIILEKKISAKKKQILQHSLVEIICNLDLNILNGSKPNIHYEYCLLQIKTDIFSATK